MTAERITTLNPVTTDTIAVLPNGLPAGFVDGANVLQFPLSQPTISEHEILQAVQPYEQYVHDKFIETDTDGVERAEEAWRVQAASYLGMGFVNDSAIDSERGWMVDEIDHARGEGVTYNTARSMSGAIATMRTITPPDVAGYRWLPAYAATSSGLSNEGAATLDHYEQEGTEIIEIAGLASDPIRDARGINEIIRRKLYQDMGGDTPKAWFFSVVSTTRDVFARNWGDDNLRLLGNAVCFNDPRVREGVKLVPSMLDPSTFHDTLLDSMKAEQAKPTPDLRRVKRLLLNFRFFTQGLDLSRVSDRVATAATELDNSSSN